jgi:hypothetical protein
MQNFLKRLYLILVTVFLAVIVVMALLAPFQVGDWLTNTLAQTSVILRIVLGVILGGGLLALTYLQVRPVAQERNGLVMRVSGAITDVSIESARDRILKTIEAVPDVISAEATIKPVRGRADMELRVVVMGHGIRLPDKQKEINRALKQVINKQLGLQMAGRPRIHIELHGVTDRDAAPVTATPPADIKPPVKPAEPAKPVEAKTPAKTVEPEEEAKNGGGLFGGWRRGRHPEPQPDTPAVSESRLPAARTPLPLEEDDKVAAEEPEHPSPVAASTDKPAPAPEDIADDEVGSDTLILSDDEQISARRQLSEILGMALDEDDTGDSSETDESSQADEDEDESANR